MTVVTTALPGTRRHVLVSPTYELDLARQSDRGLAGNSNSGRLQLILVFAALTSLLLAMVLPRTAAASPYTYTGTQASFTSSVGQYLTAGSHTVRTNSLSTGADSVLHIIDPSGVGVYSNDDCNVFTVSSCVTFTVPTAGAYTFLVYAFPGSPGTANLIVDTGSPTPVTLGGTLINGVLHGNYVYETALSTGGSTDTRLWAFDCSTGYVAKSNDDGGVGFGSQISCTSGSCNVCQILVSAYSTWSAGPTNLYINDSALGDPDGDTIGKLLEDELRTCEKGGGYTGSYCTDVFNGVDTDRDGLSDAFEIFGKDMHLGDTPQYLPQWGASPRHKDVFIEADWYNATSQPMTAADASSVAALYATGSASDLKNADGAGGVSLHFDLGIASSGTLYGAWGGASLSNTSNFKAAPADPANFAQTRFGLFHYQLIWVGSSGGTTMSPYDRYLVDGPWDIAHELGHGLNISHSGTPSSGSWLAGGTPGYPAGQMDCKPNYPSLMNYAATSSTFSLGTHPLVVNPSNVKELGNSFVTDATYLGSPPWTYPIDGSHTGVDWNRDGSWVDSVAGNRETTTWGNFCTWATRNMQIPSGLDGGKPLLRSYLAATPKLLKLGTRLYAFYISASDYKIHYYQGAVSGADQNGSCPGGSAYDIPDFNPAYHSPCMTWSGDNIINASSYATYKFSAVASSSAVQFVYYDGSGNMRQFNSSSVDASGNLTGWSSDSLVTAGVVGEPELANTYVDGSGVPVIGLYYLTSSGFQWKTATAAGGTWTSKGAVLDGSGAALTGTVSPSVASTSNRTCGVFPDSSGNSRFHCLDIAAPNRWTDYSSTMFALTPGYQAQTVKVGLAFHVLRDSNGGPLYGDSTVGQFWMATVQPGGVTSRNLLIYTSSKLSSTITPSGAMNFVWYAWGASLWDSVFAGTGISLYEDPTLSALKGYFLADGGSLSASVFAPFVDGTLNETQRDVNDFQVMERGICLGARFTISGGGLDTAFCGTINAFGY
jgi:hypothetical protein